MKDYFRAISSLRKGSNFSALSDKYEDILWQDENKTIPTKKECEDELVRLEAEDAKVKYKDERKKVYPEIGDQLDDLFRQGVFSKEMSDKLQRVKTDNPKPE